MYFYISDLCVLKDSEKKFANAAKAATLALVIYSSQ